MTQQDLEGMIMNRIEEALNQVWEMPEFGFISPVKLKNSLTAKQFNDAVYKVAKEIAKLNKPS